MNKFNTKSAFQFDEIDYVEAKILDASFRGGVIYGNSEIGIFENCCKLDINAFYPSLFTNHNIQVPYCKGEFKMLKEIDINNIECGIYFCHLEGPETKLYSNTKMYNDRYGWFNNYDILSAIEHGFKIEMCSSFNHDGYEYVENRTMKSDIIYEKNDEVKYEMKYNKRKDIIGMIREIRKSGTLEFNCIIYNKTIDISDLFKKKMPYLYDLKSKCETGGQKQIIKDIMN